jgi:hypothetical protein
MSWLDVKYISLLSSRLDKFVQKNQNLYNFRCVYCDDSKTSKHKARGYLFERANKWFYFCHNCLMSTTFDKFLKTNFPYEYEQYVFEKYLSDEKPILEEVKETVELKTDFDLPKISELSSGHDAVTYLRERNIPLEYHNQLYYTDTFKEFTNGLIPDKFEDFKYDESRIIIPIKNRQNKWIGYQGRAVEYNPIKYLTITFDEGPKLFNTPNVNFNKPYYITEGPFDSMFLDNAIASCGSHLESELIKANIPKDNAVLIFDNEPRNKQIVRVMEHALHAKMNVVIWPDNLKEKDINDIINSKISEGKTLETARSTVSSIIENNIYHTLSGELRLSRWRKI